jgi:hypothetical protein
MWFLRRGHLLPAYPLEALLVVDLTKTGQPLARSTGSSTRSTDAPAAKQSGSASDAAATTYTT